MSTMPVWYQKEGRLFVQVSQYEAFELEPLPHLPPDMWRWHALPWDYFSTLGVSEVAAIQQATGDKEKRG